MVLISLDLQDSFALHTHTHTHTHTYVLNSVQRFNSAVSFDNSLSGSHTSEIIKGI